MAWKGTITSVDTGCATVLVKVTFTNDVGGSIEQTFGINHETDDWRR